MTTIGTDVSATKGSNRWFRLNWRWDKRATYRKWNAIHRLPPVTWNAVLQSKSISYVPAINLHDQSYPCANDGIRGIFGITVRQYRSCSLNFLLFTAFRLPIVVHVSSTKLYVTSTMCDVMSSFCGFPFPKCQRINSSFQKLAFHKFMSCLCRGYCRLPKKLRYFMSGCFLARFSQLPSLFTFFSVL